MERGCDSLLNERRFISAFQNERVRDLCTRYYMQLYTKYSFTAEADDHFLE